MAALSTGPFPWDQRFSCRLPALVKLLPEIFPPGVRQLGQQGQTPYRVDVVLLNRKDPCNIRYGQPMAGTVEQREGVPGADLAFLFDRKVYAGTAARQEPLKEII